MRKVFAPFLERYGIHGAAAGIVALVGFLVEGFLEEKITISKPWFLLIICSTLYAFCIFLYEFRLLQNKSAFESPRLIKVLKQDDDRIMFLFASSSWLSIGLGYTIFYVSNDVEYPLAAGVASNIQTNGLIQIVSLRLESAETSVGFVKKLLDGGGDEFRNVIVKPGVPANV